ncbi:MAG: ABC transporter substrate-binding protein [Xanthobacteraceae bacterium]|jgi:putative ABC transport system substrate-binding protein
MRRRTFITLLGGAVATWPSCVYAERTTKLARIGFLATGALNSAEQQVILSSFQQGLRERGYVEGVNIVVEYRGANGKIERFPELATELVRLSLDLIVASNTPAARAAKEATTTVPIVVPVMGDPVGDGLVASLARPGGNITGMTFLGPELATKRLELLKQALPTISRVAALWHPHAYGESTMREMMRKVETAAGALMVQLQLVEVRGAAELDRAFLAMARERADALIVLPSPMLFSERRHIVDLATGHRLPSIAMAREFADLGGLLAYGASIPDLFRRAVLYVDLILQGMKPADLPVQQPTKFELVINLKTANALGVNMPPSLLATADEVIE